MTPSIKQVLWVFVLSFGLGVAADAYINTRVTKQICHAQREQAKARKQQVASKAQLMAVPVAFNVRDPRIATYLPKLPVRRLKP